MAKIDAARQKATVESPTKAGILNRPRSSIGSAVKRSLMKKPTMRTAAPASRLTVVALPQPKSLPRTSANTKQEEAHREGDEAHPVDPTRAQVLRLGDLGERDEHGDGADGHVHEEDPAPADATGDGAADERADGDGAADDGAVDAEGRAAVASGEGRRNERERGGEHDGAADALHGAGQVEHQGRGREPADQRGQREDDEADGEDLPPPVDVARHSGRQQEGGQRQRIGVHHPLQVREARVQRRLDVRERHVHDRDVEQEHEGRRADGDQGPPFAVESGHSRSVSTWCSRPYNEV